MSKKPSVISKFSRFEPYERLAKYDHLRKTYVFYKDDKVMDKAIGVDRILYIPDVGVYCFVGDIMTYYSFDEFDYVTQEIDYIKRQFRLHNILRETRDGLVGDKAIALLRRVKSRFEIAIKGVGEWGWPQIEFLIEHYSSSERYDYEEGIVTDKNDENYGRIWIKTTRAKDKE